MKVKIQFDSEQQVDDWQQSRVSLIVIFIHVSGPQEIYLDFATKSQIKMLVREIFPNSGKLIFGGILSRVREISTWQIDRVF